MIHIQTIPTGQTDYLGRRAGSIIAVMIYPNGQALNAAAFTSANIASIELPSDVPETVCESLLGAYITTTKAAGLHAASTYADNAAFTADLNALPAKVEAARTELLLENIVYNKGAGWILNDALLKQVTTFTITTAGTGYSTVSEVDVTKATGDGLKASVEITSVNGSGAITGVTVVKSGLRFAVGDTVTVGGGGGNAVLTVSAIANVS